MINLFVVNHFDVPINARVYIGNANEVLINATCINGKLYRPKVSFIDKGWYNITIRLYTDRHYYKSIEFQSYQEQDSDLDFCVKMEYD